MPLNEKNEPFCPYTTYTVVGMTANGAIGRTAILLAIFIASIAFSWGFPIPFGVVVVLLGGVARYFMRNKPELARFCAPVIAIAQGFVIGTSADFLNPETQTLALKALGLSTGVMLGTLLIFRIGLISPTEETDANLYFVGGIFGLISIGATDFVLKHIGFDATLTGDAVKDALVALGIGGLLGCDQRGSIASLHHRIESESPKHMAWDSAASLLFSVISSYTTALFHLKSAKAGKGLGRRTGRRSRGI